MTMSAQKNHIPNRNTDKPNLPKRLFWDWRYDAIDWQQLYPSVIARVLERGTNEEWEELIRFYGQPKIITALKEEILYLPDYSIDGITGYFNLKKEELACYTRKQLRSGHWI
jgi:hypothetical protein